MLLPLRASMFQFLGFLLCSTCALRYGAIDERSTEPQPRDLQDTVGTVQDFILVNSGSDRAILTIRNGQIIDTVRLNTFRFNINVTVSGNVQSIKFGYNTRPLFRRENGGTYAFCGHNGTNFFKCDVLGIGTHTITATPYTRSNLGGEEGSPVQLTFSIINSTSTCAIPTIDPDWDSIPPEYPFDAPETQAAILGNNVFITGGFRDSFTDVTTQSFARDISIQNSPWLPMEDMPVSIGITHASLVTIGMKMYMCGGYEGIRPGRHVPNCFIYDQSKPPGSGQWSAFSDLPNGGSAGGGMIYDSVRRMLFYSGGGQRLTPDSLETTDVVNTWKISIDALSSGWNASAPFPYRGNHISSVTAKDSMGNERHFFAGGQIGENELDGNVGDMFEFMTSTETWIRRASLPTNRSHTTISTRAVGCGFVMAGGTVNSMTSKKNRTSEILYYHVPTNRWTRIGNIPLPRATPVVVIDDNNFIYYVNDRRTSRSQMVV